MDITGYPIIKQLPSNVKDYRYSIIFGVKAASYLPVLKEMGSSGYDVTVEPFEVNNGTDVPFFAHTGVKVFMPNGYHCQMYPRSSMFRKYGLLLGNSVGLIDSSYRGEILASLYFGVQVGTYEWHPFENGDRNDLLQLVFTYSLTHRSFPPRHLSCLHVVGVVDEKLWYDWDKQFPSDRGDGGFGSTDK